MKLIFLLFICGAAVADKLQSNYLPPSSARTAGGGSFLTAPSPSHQSSFGHTSSFTRTGVSNSYIPPASGISGQYNAGVTANRYSGASSYSGSYSSGQPNINILRYNNDNNGDGSYRFEYETENKISQQEEGHLQNAGSEHEANVVRGSYSYQAPDGQTITVNYVADENGFRPEGAHLPTAPPIPPAILKSLEINAAGSGASGYSSDGGYSSSFGGSQVNRQYLAPRTSASGDGGYKY